MKRVRFIMSRSLLIAATMLVAVSGSSVQAATVGGTTISLSPGASDFTINFDENGNCTGCLGATVAPDPTHLVSGNVLIYTLPAFVVEGDVGINNSSGQLSDALVFTDASGTITGAGDLMIFYSFDDLGSLADVGLPAGFSPSIGATELPDGAFTYAPTGNVYNGVSDVVPLPPAIYLFGSVLGGAFWLSRRKRSAAPSGLAEAV